MDKDREIRLIALDRNNVDLIKSVKITDAQKAYEDQTLDHVDLILQDIPGRIVERFAIQWNDQIVGCVRLILPPEKDLCSISALAISRPFQGQGLGKKALQEIKSYVQVHFPKTRFIGLAVNRENLAAVSLYIGFGFNYYGKFDEKSDTYRFPLPHQ